MFLKENLTLLDFKISSCSERCMLSDSPAPEFYILTLRNTLFHVHTYSHIMMERTECSETSAHKIQTPGHYPKESIQ
jgi:hypothetical protein